MKHNNHANSLLGLLFTLKSQAEKLEPRIAGIEQRLRDEGITDQLQTVRDVADALSRRRPARTQGMFVGTDCG